MRNLQRAMPETLSEAESVTEGLRLSHVMNDSVFTVQIKFSALKKHNG